MNDRALAVAAGSISGALIAVPFTQWAGWWALLFPGALFAQAAIRSVVAGWRRGREEPA